MRSVKHIAHKDIDFKKWDATILSSAIPFVFAQSFYLNATCPNWDALVINNYESVFPIPQKVKFGFKYLPQPPFTSQLGAYGKLNLDIEQQFYDYIISHYIHTLGDGCVLYSTTFHYIAILIFLQYIYNAFITSQM